MNSRYRGSYSVFRSIHKATLTPEQLAKLRELVCAHGRPGAAKLLKCGVMSVTELVTGGALRPDTVERIAKALEGT